MQKLREIAGRWSIWQGAIMLFLVLALAGALRGCADERYARQNAERRVEEVIRLRNGAEARLAHSESNRRELLELKESAGELNGQLVAGVKIHVRSDTILVPTRVAATTYATDSTRHATLTDTVGGYRVTVTGRAPPFPAPLELGYDLVTPEFNPEVGFVRRGNDYYAVVSWEGKRVETSEAFFRPQRERPLSVVVGASASAAPTARIDQATLHGNAYVGVQYRLSPKMEAQLRATYAGDGPRIGVQVERKLF